MRKSIISLLVGLFLGSIFTPVLDTGASVTVESNEEIYRLNGWLRKLASQLTENDINGAISHYIVSKSPPDTSNRDVWSEDRVVRYLLFRRLFEDLMFSGKMERGIR